MEEGAIERQWSTSEVARDLGISPSLVRTWIAYMGWEVRRNAEGHRIFTDEDVEQLRQLRAHLDGGQTLREFRRERQGEGPYDPRLELRNGLKRLRELHSQEEALLLRQKTWLEQWGQDRAAFLSRLEALAAVEEAAPTAPSPSAPVEKPPAAPSTSETVQGVLKQLLSALMERQGRLQFLGRRDADGRAWLDYMGPGGRMQTVEDLCATEADRRLLATVLDLIAASGAPARG